MSGGGTRVLVAALLLVTVGPWAPVLCVASGHVAVEMPYELCCGPQGGSHSEAPGGPSLCSALSASDCRDCTDTPLVSVWRPALQNTVSLEAAPASVPAGLELPSEFSANFALNREVCGPSTASESLPSPLR